MAKKDIFGDEIVDGKAQDYERFLAETSKPVRKISVGDRLKGEVLSVGKEEVYISTEGPVDAVVARKELLDEQGEVKVKKGEVLEIIVTQVREDVIRAKPADSRSGTEEIDNLEDAHDMEIPVEGRVLEFVKGGFRVQIQSYKAFCPMSQMDLGQIKKPEDYVNKKFEFLITQIDERHTNIVVSRRKFLELLRSDREGEVLSKLREGDLVEGHVTRIESFGAFVEVMPLVEGLIHVSELSWARIKHPGEVLEVGAPVKVKILKLQESDQRLHISLSLKQGGGEQDPWIRFTQQNPVGTKIEGSIERKEPFGFFVKLASCVNGLLHQSKWRDVLDGKSIEAKRPGDSLWVEIEKIDFEAHKISLRLPGEGEDQSWRDHLPSPSTQGLGTLASLFQKASKK